MLRTATFLEPPSQDCLDFLFLSALVSEDGRFNKLVNFIDYYLDNEIEKEITVRKLFFDKI